MTLSKYYQTPEILPALDADPDSNRKPSDHKIVKCEPITTVNNKNARTTRSIEVQPLTDSGIRKMKTWLMSEKWGDVIEAETADKKAELVQEH